MPNSNRKEFPTEVEDRRRSPRVNCAGLAKIISLPSDGLTGPAKVLNLSLGGCGIETDFPLKSGTRAEILLQVNGSSFRATCQVRALRAPHGIGLEFVHLSTLGQDMLKELIRELARQRAIASPNSAIQRKSASHWERREFAGRRSELSAGSRFVNPGPRAGFIYLARERASREAAERESPARQCRESCGED